MTLTEFHVINTEKIAMNNHISEHDELILEVKNLKKFYKAKTNSHFFGKKENLWVLFVVSATKLKNRQQKSWLLPFDKEATNFF